MFRSTGLLVFILALSASFARAGDKGAVEVHPASKAFSAWSAAVEAKD